MPSLMLLLSESCIPDVPVPPKQNIYLVPVAVRTLYDLEKTIARIKAATSHLKGLKIGIMGCIVNGPGEMADADYGYVGAGRGKSVSIKARCVWRKIFSRRSGRTTSGVYSDRPRSKPTMILYWARNTGDGVLSS